MSHIHPTALVDPTAELGQDVEVGPFALVGAGVRIGEGTRIGPRATILGDTHLGENNTVGVGAVLGEPPQDLSFDPSQPSSLTIGKGNTFREYVTIHRSASTEGVTSLGDDNFLMANAHVGHDCHLGNGNILANAVLLGGHVTVADHCFFGGGAVFHQQIRIGSFVMAQGMAGHSQDVPPYLMTAGVNQVAGINVVGLRRGGFSAAERKEIKELFRLLYRRGLNFPQAQAAIAEGTWGEAAEAFVQFLQADSKKGVLTRLAAD
ncbi:MAG: acyl-ACP--UDP-N-acetylglucosamine O-acyltransferase [Verrucomicrobiota bacterium]